MLIIEEGVSGRAANALQRFLELIENMDRECGDQELEFQIQHVTKASNIIAHNQEASVESFHNFGV